MRHVQYTLNHHHVHARAAHLVQDYLHLADYKRRCPATVLIRLL